MANHPSILAWRIPWTEKHGRIESIRSQRDKTEAIYNACTLQPIVQKDSLYSTSSPAFIVYSFLFIYLFTYFTILYWFCHTSTCIRHGCTRVPHPEPPSYLPPHTIPLVHPSAPAPSLLYPASNLDW